MVTLIARARPGRGCARQIGTLLMLVAAAWATGVDDAMASRSTSPPEAGAPASGVGGPGESLRPRTPTEAVAAHAATVRKCRLLSVRAVREECLRQAQRTLELELERLRRGTTGTGR